jgi:type I restriction enzyme R subunit
MNTHVTLANLNEFGRFDDLKATVDQQKAKTYFEGLESKARPLFRVNIRAAKLLQDFIIQAGRDN